jgi:hypothetical protein
VRDSPAVIFGALALLVTGTLAWIVKFLVEGIGHAVRLPKENP